LTAELLCIDMPYWTFLVVHITCRSGGLKDEMGDLQISIVALGWKFLSFEHTGLRSHAF
jgi:hypothetical protein